MLVPRKSLGMTNSVVVVVNLLKIVNLGQDKSDRYVKL